MCIRGRVKGDKMAKRIQDFRNLNLSDKEATSANNTVGSASKIKSKKEKKHKKNIKEEKSKKANKVSNKFGIFLIFLIITGVSVGCLFSPTFDLNGIIVNDGVNVKRSEILNSFEVDMGTNIFKVNYKEIENAILTLPYIKNVNAKIEFPNQIKIEYIEREPFALVKYLESYMVMDKYGYILEISRQNKFPELPIIYNIEFDSYEIGKQFDDTAKTKYDNVVYLLENATRSSFPYIISEINYESIGNVKIWMKDTDIEIIYGEIDRDFITEKLNYIAEVLKRIEGKKGKIDLSNSDGKTIFTERL